MNIESKKIKSDKYSVKDKVRAAVSKADGINKKTSLIYLSIMALVIAAGVIAPEIALASAKLDLKAGAKAATDPVVELIKEYWGTGVAVGACTGAVVGEGDLRQRGIKAAMGAGIAGAAFLAILAMFTK